MGAISFELRVMPFKAVRDIFKGDHAEHDMLVLGGIQVGTESVSRTPEFRIDAGIRTVVIVFGHSDFHFVQSHTLRMFRSLGS